MPKKHQALSIFDPSSSNELNNKKSIISHFFSSTNCVICESTCEKSICDNCKENNTHSSLILLSNKIYAVEKKLMAVKQICETCCGRSIETDCISMDCPNLYALTNIKREYKQVDFWRNILNELN